MFYSLLEAENGGAHTTKYSKPAITMISLGVGVGGGRPSTFS